MSNSPSMVDDILAEYQGLEAQLGDPELHNDPAAARKVGKRFSELQPIIQTHQQLEQAVKITRPLLKWRVKTRSLRKKQSALKRKSRSSRKS